VVQGSLAVVNQAAAVYGSARFEVEGEESVHIAYLAFVDISGTSGENIFSRELAAALGRQAGVRMSLICPEPEAELPARFSSDQIVLRYLPAKKRQSLRWHLGIQPLVLKSLSAAEAELGPLDGMFVTLRVGTIAPLVFSWVRRVPEVLVVEGMEARNVGRLSRVPGSGSIMHGITWANALASKHVFGAYQSIKDWIGGMPFVDDDKVSTFHHGVSVEYFPAVDRLEAREGLGTPLPQDAFVVGYLGSFKWYHRVDALLGAVAELDRPDVRVMLIGDGPERAESERLANDLGLGERAVFTGHVDHARVGPYLAACDVLHGARDPNHWCHPIKIFEYMAAGRPVIAFGSTDMRFVGSIGAGIALEDVTVGSVRGAIEKLIELPAEERERMGEIGRTRVLSEHTWDKVAQSMLGAIKSN